MDQRLSAELEEWKARRRVHEKSYGEELARLAAGYNTLCDALARDPRDPEAVAIARVHATDAYRKAVNEAFKNFKHNTAWIDGQYNTTLAYMQKRAATPPEQRPPSVFANWAPRASGQQ